MLVFIDDSGDPSFSIEKGSSRFFVIAAVIFEDDLVAEETALSIKKLKRDLKIPEVIEFKFTKSQRKVRVKFLETINKFEFKIRTLEVDKTIIKSPELKSKKESFYSYFIKMLLKHNQGTINNAKVRIDGSGDRIFRKTFLGYLRKELNQNNKKVLRNCKLVDSKSDILIQMADMIAGSIHRSLKESKKDSTVYKAIIKKHIEDEWNFR